MVKRMVILRLFRWIPTILLTSLTLSVIRQSYIGFLGEYDPHPNAVGFLLRMLPVMILLILMIIGLKYRFYGGLFLIIFGPVFGASFGWFRLTRSYPALALMSETSNSLWFRARPETAIISTCGALYVLSYVFDGTLQRNWTILIQNLKVNRTERLKRLSELNK